MTPQSTSRTRARPRSGVTRRAGAVLRREALRSAGAHIHLVPGTTMTSRAHVLSLRSALRAAHL